MLAREIFQDDKYVENLKNKLESAEDKRKVLLVTSFFLVILGTLGALLVCTAVSAIVSVEQESAAKRVSRARECSKME